MNAETLRCAVCQREVRIVRLGHSTLALGHTTNPRNGRHRVQLARADRNAVPAATGLREGLNSREDASPSPRSVARPSTGRTPSAGVGHDRAPSSSPAGKARRTGAAPRPTAPRLPRSAGTL